MEQEIKNTQENHSSETVVALLQRDVSYIRAAQDKQSDQLSKLGEKLDNAHIPFDSLKDRIVILENDITTFRSKHAWYDKIFGFIGVTVASTIIYAFMRLIIK